MIFTIISAGIFSTFIGILIASNNVSLLRPRWNVPVIRMANESFFIEAETSVPLLDASDFSASITSIYGDFELDIVNNNIQVDGKSIKVEVGFPSNVVNDTLYDLDISVGGLSDNQSHAVKVVQEYHDEFKIIIWGDTQVGYSPDFSDEESARAFEFVKEMVIQANLINPEFIFIVGDFTEVALHEEYEFMFEQCMRLQVPIYIGPGNHDYFNIQEYIRWCEYTYFSFDYGPDYHFNYVDTGMNLDALRDHVWDWLVSDIEAHSDFPVQIVAGHAPPYQCDGVDVTEVNRNFENHNAEFVELLEERNVPAYFYGHNNKDKITYANCTPVDMSSPLNQTWYVQVRSGRESAGYRVVEFKDKQMVNTTILTNAITGARHDNASLSAFVSEETMIPSIEVYKNDTSSVVNSISINITNRFEQEYMNNVTIRVHINGTDADCFSNSTGYYGIVKEDSVVDVPNTIMVEMNFYLPNNDTINIEIWKV
ncbi:MAG: metallophosphoesterase family protein [Candidatus Hodarchaeota archaeon]